MLTMLLLNEVLLDWSKQQHLKLGSIILRLMQLRQQRQAAEQFLEEYNALPVLLLEPSDVADSVVFLVSPQVKYITSTVIDVAAGANARYTA